MQNCSIYKGFVIKDIVEKGQFVSNIEELTDDIMSALFFKNRNEANEWISKVSDKDHGRYEISGVQSMWLFE